LKNTYKECSTLLPGIFSFHDSYFDAIENEFTPWIFRTPCTSFERLEKSRYFKNFTSNDQSITIANYESLEGIFLGISRGKKPCHICAAVSMDILKECKKCEKEKESENENTPCSKVIEEISSRYSTVFGIVRYSS